MSHPTKSNIAQPARQAEAARTATPSRPLERSGPYADVLALQRAAGNRAVSGLVQKGASGVPPIVRAVLSSGGGQPLDPSTRSFMESRFEHDFGQVRVHSDAQAADSARAVEARAYTVGRDVVFGEGRYAPGASEGRKLLAHELTHVVQQRGSSRSVPSKFDVSQLDEAHEHEADMIAQAAILGHNVSRITTMNSEGHIQRAAVGAGSSQVDVDELIQQRKVDEKVLKKQVIESWKKGGGNKPVKVVSVKRGPGLQVRGYITQEKYISGRTPEDMEKILGLPAGELSQNGGAIVEVLEQIPSEGQFKLKAYSQLPGGKTYVPGEKYPPGLGAPQWELVEELPAKVVGTVGSGERFLPGASVRLATKPAASQTHVPEASSINQSAKPSEGTTAARVASMPAELKTSVPEAPAPHPPGGFLLEAGVSPARGAIEGGTLMFHEALAQGLIALVAEQAEDDLLRMSELIGSFRQKGYWVVVDIEVEEPDQPEFGTEAHIFTEHSQIPRFRELVVWIGSSQKEAQRATFSAAASRYPAKPREGYHSTSYRWQIFAPYKAGTAPEIPKEFRQPRGQAGTYRVGKVLRAEATSEQDIQFLREHGSNRRLRIGFRQQSLEVEMVDTSGGEIYTVHNLKWDPYNSEIRAVFLLPSRRLPIESVIRYIGGPKQEELLENFEARDTTANLYVTGTISWVKE